jgi:hypothetical protein
MVTDTETRRVIFIEFSRDKPRRPFTIVTDEGEYVVEWCKRDETLYYHEGGSGGLDTEFKPDKGDVFWAAPDAIVRAEEGATRLKRTKWKARFEGAVNDGWGADGISEGETIYCEACDDFLPTEDTDNPCDHIWWCDDAVDWSSPDERCPWDCEDCHANGWEVGPAPPMMLIARGYGKAASSLAVTVRSIMARYGHTPESLAKTMRWCDQGKHALAAALRGEASSEVDANAIDWVAHRLKLDEDERVGLMEAFGFDDD